MKQHPMDKLKKKLKSMGFKKRWLGDKSGWWYEKTVKHWLFGRVEITIEEIDVIENEPEMIRVYIGSCWDAAAIIPVKNLDKVLKVFK